jgi:hypothetical protein
MEHAELFALRVAHDPEVKATLACSSVLARRARAWLGRRATKGNALLTASKNALFRHSTLPLLQVLLTSGAHESL